MYGSAPAPGPTPGRIKLRDIISADLAVFFEHQQDPEANTMAAFTAKDPGDWQAFTAHWQKILADETILLRTILFDGHCAGYILSHAWFGKPELSYWIGRAYWGRGVASAALAAFLDIQELRPLYAHAAKDNVASLRVLEKYGFTKVGEGKGYSHARSQEVEEYVLELR
jgi:RimJ/RimL family protein N-acetyltransferase